VKLAEAEAAVEKARASAEADDNASQELSLDGDLAPAIKPDEKVRQYVDSSCDSVHVELENSDHPGGGSEIVVADRADNVVGREMVTAPLPGTKSSAVTDRREEDFVSRVNVQTLACAERGSGRPKAKSVGIGNPVNLGFVGEDPRSCFNFRNHKDSSTLLPPTDTTSNVV